MPVASQPRYALSSYFQDFEISAALSINEIWGEGGVGLGLWNSPYSHQRWGLRHSDVLSPMVKVWE